MNKFEKSDKLPTNLDYFFFAANCNNRCYHVISKLHNDDYPIESITIFDYEKFTPDPNDTASIINYNKCKEFSPNEPCKCSNKNEDIKYIRKLEINESSTVGLDITGFAIPDIFRIFFILKVIKKIKNLHVFYTEPKHYLFKENVFDTYEYLTGEMKYKPIEGYYTTDFTDEILVCFLGFDQFISNILYERGYPKETLLVNGFPSYLPKLKEISLLNNYSLLTTDYLSKEAKLFAKANNPFSSYNTLCEIKREYPDEFLNICVLGTKPMAVGACMFALENQSNVKATYLYPQNYSSNTSDEINDSWHYIIEFD